MNLCCARGMIKIQEGVEAPRQCDCQLVNDKNNPRNVYRQDLKVAGTSFTLSPSPHSIAHQIHNCNRIARLYSLVLGPIIDCNPPLSGTRRATGLALEIPHASEYSARKALHSNTNDTCWAYGLLACSYEALRRQGWPLATHMARATPAYRLLWRC